MYYVYDVYNIYLNKQEPINLCYIDNETALLFANVLAENFSIIIRLAMVHVQNRCQFSSCSRA